MKKFLFISLLLLALVCALASCNYEPTKPNVTVSDDGYVVVNGIKTEFKVDTEDKISVNADGYVVVNGVTTSILADKDDVITVDEDGYVVVNGVKTEYEIKVAPEECSHRYDQNGICTECNSVILNKIQYAVSDGTKIETLPTSEQNKIDEYVADCKTLYTVGYAYNVISTFSESSIDPYISFTDTFIYDFSNIKEESLNSESLILWNKIKSLNEGESKPIMYIELSGYVEYFPNYKPDPLQNYGILNGFFIFEDETVIPMTYHRICTMVYVFELVQGTQLINCGNKYAEEINSKKITDLYSALKGGMSYSEILKRLSAEEK